MSKSHLVQTLLLVKAFLTKYVVGKGISIICLYANYLKNILKMNQR